MMARPVLPNSCSSAVSKLFRSGLIKMAGKLRPYQRLFTIEKVFDARSFLIIIRSFWSHTQRNCLIAEIRR